MRKKTIGSPDSTFLIQPYISSEDTFYDSDGNAWQDKKGMKTIAIMDVTNNDLAGFTAKLYWLEKEMQY